MSRLLDEVADFIARGPTSDEVIHWHASAAANQRVTYLIQHEREGLITPERLAELNRALALEHLVRLARAKARAYAIK